VFSVVYIQYLKATHKNVKTPSSFLQGGGRGGEGGILNFLDSDPNDRLIRSYRQFLLKYLNLQDNF
jgi:hypothetical protein